MSKPFGVHYGYSISKRKVKYYRWFTKEKDRDQFFNKLVNDPLFNKIYTVVKKVNR